MKKLFSLSLLIGSITFSNGLQSQSANDAYWTATTESSIPVKGKRQIIPQKFLTVSLNGSALKDKLFSAPHERAVKINESACVISLPLPNGQMQLFKVVESPVMAPELGATFPDIKTFSIKGIDDPYANGKLDWVESGFHAMVRTINGDFFIDPYCVGNVTDYLSYYTADFQKDPAHILPEEGVITGKEEGAGEEEPKTGYKQSASPATCVGPDLRIYRLVVSCTGEYAVAATGFAAPTVAQTLGRIVTSVNRVDGVYETEVAVRMVLIPTQTLVVFTNPTTDPFTANNNGGALLGQNQTVVTATIGGGNYDIGHIFSTGGGGIANLGSVCDAGNKARGVTGSPNPVGDPYDIDYVAHEMGHQFAGNHPFNAGTGSCSGNRNQPTSMEPGSGVTIMAYAGICGTNDLANNSIPYFHAISYDEIVNFITLGSNCANIGSSGNQAPVVTGSGDYTVPKSTAFILTGSATDPDNDALTYSWEETDAGTGGASNWNSGNKPYFRSYTPTSSPTRSFPNEAVVLSGNYTGTKGEYAPPTAQVLQFRLTARDNKMGGGGVCYAINNINVDNAGPFKVTYPNASNIIWGSGTQQTILWDVNNTDVAPVACSDVKISISLNGGTTYSVLVATTPNDGIQTVTVPTVPADINTCRIKIESIGNIFYDVDDFNFTISTLQGINAASQNNTMGLTVWPNPFNGQVNFSVGNLNSETPTQLSVVDVLGKVVFKTSYTHKMELKETLDLSSVNKGIYFIKVTNDNNQAVYRIIKD